MGLQDPHHRQNPILRDHSDARQRIRRGHALASDIYPEALRGESDEVNARVHQTVNNGVLRADFANSQAGYEEAIGPLFAASLDRAIGYEIYAWCGCPRNLELYWI